MHPCLRPRGTFSPQSLLKQTCGPQYRSHLQRPTRSRVHVYILKLYVGERVWLGTHKNIPVSYPLSCHRERFTLYIFGTPLNRMSTTTPTPPQQTNVRRFVLFPLLLNKVTSHYTQSNNLRIVSAPPGTVTQTCVSKFGARIQKKGGVKL